ncbi:MAG: TonB-dependent receptor [Bacteroidota bacterium]
MKITGTVLDSTGTKPFEKASAIAVRMKDSLLLGHTRSDKDGKFTLTGFPVDTFSLIISSPGYDDKTYFMFGHSDNFEIDIPQIRMSNQAKELDEIVIYSNKNPIFYRGDTLVYVADSFKVAEGAVVEDLLKKLPGITVDKDGKIKSQGQDITKVLVDGDEFFGTDPTIATKNLGAEGVESVQIYEKEDEDNIGNSDQKIKVLDLKLKDGYKKGYFGRVSGASDFWATPVNNYFGTRPFYEGELLFNYFNGKRKISVFSLGSNTPKSNFGRSELNKFGLENESSGSQNFWEDNSNNTRGIPQTLKAGVYYSDQFGKKENVDFLFNYSYYNDVLDTRSASKSQYFLTDTTYFTDDSTRNLTKYQAHNLNARFDIKIDSLTTLGIRPELSYSNNHGETSDFSTFLGEDNIQSLGTHIENDVDLDGLAANGTITLERKFMKKKRELDLRYDIQTSNSKSESKLYTQSDYYLLSQSDTIDQQKQNVKNSIENYFDATYKEPFAKDWLLEVNYLFEYGISSQNRSTYDRLNGNYTSYRDDLSSNFDNNRMQNRAGFSFYYTHKNHVFRLGTFARNISIDNRNLLTDTTITQNINSILPVFVYEFKPSMSTRLDVRYRTSSDAPTIDDLMPIPDNSNPNRIRSGNPNLKPNYTHTLSANFNKWSALSGSYFWSGTSIVLTDNAFGTSTSYDQFGRQVSQTVNVDGNFSANLWVGGGVPVYKRIIELRPGLISAFYRSKSLVMNEENSTDNLFLNPFLEVLFRWDSLEIVLNGNFQYNNPKSSLSMVSNTPFMVHQYSADVEWKLPLGFTIGVDGTFNMNRQKDAGFYNREFFVLNAEVSKKFLKTQNLVLSLIGNDILNQNVNAARVVNGNFITDNRTTIVSRYFLMKLTYRFNNNKTKEEDAPHRW